MENLNSHQCLSPSPGTLNHLPKTPRTWFAHSTSRICLGGATPSPYCAPKALFLTPIDYPACSCHRPHPATCVAPTLCRFAPPPFTCAFFAISPLLTPDQQGLPAPTPPSHTAHCVTGADQCSVIRVHRSLQSEREESGFQNENYRAKKVRKNA